MSTAKQIQRSAAVKKITEQPAIRPEFKQQNTPNGNKLNCTHRFSFVSTLKLLLNLKCINFQFKRCRMSQMLNI